MKCLKCGSREFSEKRRGFGAEIKAISEFAFALLMICDQCGFTWVQSPQMNVYNEGSGGSVMTAAEILKDELIKVIRKYADAVKGIDITIETPVREVSKPLDTEYQYVASDRYRFLIEYTGGKA